MRGTIEPDPAEVIRAQQAIINKLCPDSCLHLQGNHTGTRNNIPNAPLSQPIDLDAPLTYEEIDKAIYCMKIKSSPGLDQISYTIIRSLPENYITILIEIYNKLWQEGLFPSEWRQTLVALISKPSGGGIRPIALMSCLMKIMKKVVYWRLNWYLEHHCLIPNFQSGFRKGKSCTDNLVALTSFVHAGLAKKEIISCVFLDIRGAFDNVIPAILLQDLEDIGVKGYMKTFISNIISERELYQGIQTP